MKQYLALSLLVGALTFAILSLVLDDSYGKLKNLEASVAAQREQNAEQQKHVLELQNKVFALKSDARTLEEQARNEGMARPNELIFMFDDAK